MSMMMMMMMLYSVTLVLSGFLFLFSICCYTCYAQVMYAAFSEFVRNRLAVAMLTLLLCYTFGVHIVSWYGSFSSFRPRHHNFRRPNTFITEYDTDVSGRLADLVQRRATAADPDLIRLIRDMMDPPSGHMVKMSMPLTETPQSREIDQVLEEKVTSFL